jgi:hypothetical protein
MQSRLSFFAVVLFSLPLAAQQSGTGYLKVKAHPGRAGVFVDGKYLGPAANFRVARTYSVAPGEHELKLSEPRYEDVVKKINVTAGKKTVVREDMKALPAPKPPFGMLRIKEPDKFAAVYLNDKFMGHAGEFNNGVQGLKIPPGEYALRVEPTAGGKGIQENVKIVANQTTVVQAGK